MRDNLHAEASLTDRYGLAVRDNADHSFAGDNSLWLPGGSACCSCRLLWPWPWQKSSANARKLQVLRNRTPVRDPRRVLSLFDPALLFLPRKSSGTGHTD